MIGEVRYLDYNVVWLWERVENNFKNIVASPLTGSEFVLAFPFNFYPD